MGKVFFLFFANESNCVLFDIKIKTVFKALKKNKHKNTLKKFIYFYVIISKKSTVSLMENENM